MSARRVILFVWVVYGLLGGAGLLWMGLRGDDLLHVLLAGQVRFAVAAAAGLAVALAVTLVSDAILDRFAWTDLLRREVVELLSPLTRRRVVAVALLSGVAEEVFFRGALLPCIGLVPSAVLFGLLHTAGERRLLGWALFATAAGLLLGGLFLLTGGLLAPALAHALINGIQLWRLARQRGGSRN
ncbi:MAG: CPBP family intramembrane metalloprotease [Planctomycetes bacterium]|nr:CPBP family intramembrane metalloprotease [Planctomycetota bacterium]